MFFPLSKKKLSKTLLLQPSISNSSQSSLLHSAEINSSTHSASQFTATLSSFDLNIARNGMHDSNNSTTNADNKSSKTLEHDKKHQNHHHHHQTVRFLSDYDDKKSSKKVVALAESEESIISESSYDKYANGFLEHAVVNFETFVLFFFSLLFLHLAWTSFL